MGAMRGWSSEEAASALRFSYDLAEGGAEMTEDEIRALR